MSPDLIVVTRAGSVRAWMWGLKVTHSRDISQLLRLVQWKYWNQLQKEKLWYLQLITDRTVMMLISIVILVSLLEITSSQETRDRNQLRRRCFTCRSRGEKGDCRDPFTPPEREEGAERRSSVNTAVAEADCSTGWCSKVKKISDNFRSIIQSTVSDHGGSGQELWRQWLWYCNWETVYGESSQWWSGALRICSDGSQGSLHVLLQGRSLQQCSFQQSNRNSHHHVCLISNCCSLQHVNYLKLH